MAGQDLKTPCSPRSRQTRGHGIGQGKPRRAISHSRTPGPQLHRGSDPAGAGQPGFLSQLCPSGRDSGQCPLWPQCPLQHGAGEMGHAGPSTAALSQSCQGLQLPHGNGHGLPGSLDSADPGQRVLPARGRQSQACRALGLAASQHRPSQNAVWEAAGHPLSHRQARNVPVVPPSSGDRPWEAGTSDQLSCFAKRRQFPGRGLTRNVLGELARLVTQQSQHPPRCLLLPLFLPLLVSLEMRKPQQDPSPASTRTSSPREPGRTHRELGNPSGPDPAAAPSKEVPSAAIGQARQDRRRGCVASDPQSRETLAAT